MQGKTLLITGSSRGIGHAIALRAARDGANIVVIGKTETPHERLSGTIHSSAGDIEAAGGQALACAVDIRHEQQVADAVERAVDRFGGIDIVVNNASAIFLAGTVDTPMKRYDLMHAVNVRGTFVTTQSCLPHLLRSDNPHVLNIAPPLNFEARWFAPHLAYTMSKYGMSLCVLGMAEELREQGVAVNALWPRTAIATAAISNILGGEAMLRKTRRPEIMADAAHAILVRDSRSCTGQFFIDDEVLAESGVTDLQAYAVDPSAELLPDFFV
ncbi:MAG: NAD(P)-dependent oxidoreductase [Planctomycetaceae bacterium]